MIVLRGRFVTRLATCYRTRKQRSSHRKLCMTSRSLRASSLEAEQDPTARGAEDERSATGTYAEFEKQALGELSRYKFPFENLVFEGGGTKGVAYCGAVEILEELGLLQQITRFGGASAGAMMAALLAVGCTSAEVKGYIGRSLGPYFQDTPMLYYPTNFFLDYGIHKAQRLTRYLENVIKEKSGSKHLTFWELYKWRGIELCVVVTNLNQMATEYCHPKTTPDRPISQALRMSMSIPILFQPVLHKDEYTGQWDYYVDGGVLCNYPVHCYDGWWLSMKPEHAIFHKIVPFSSAYKRFENSERFGTYNPNTLGLTLYAADEQEPFKEALERRHLNVPAPLRPYTVMSRRVMEREEKSWHDQESSEDFERAAEKFFKVLAESLTTDSGRPTIEISRRELLALIQQIEQDLAEGGESFTSKDYDLLFGEGTSLKQLLRDVDTNDDDKIDFYEIVNYMERRGLQVSKRYQCFPRAPIKGVSDFFNTLMSALMLQSNRATFQSTDTGRTIGLNTDYIYGMDFGLTQEDKEYLYQRGRWGTVSYFKYYVHRNHPPLKLEPENKA